MKIVLSTGYWENYWLDWFNAKQIGGSEWIVLNLAREFAALGHEVTLRLPYDKDEFRWGSVRVLGRGHRPVHGDRLYAFDQFEAFDDAPDRILVRFRSDPPVHTDFRELVFLSKHHAKFLGHEGRPSIGGGVNLKDYERGQKRQPGLVICTSSPDRCMAAFDIGRQFPGFFFSYKPIPGLPQTTQLTREELVQLQQKAKVLIYPLDPRRPSDFFSMAVLEALAAGTPVVVSDADSMPELWTEAAIILRRPIRIAQWVEQVEELLQNKVLWNRRSLLGKEIAAQYDWPLVAQRYLAI